MNGKEIASGQCALVKGSDFPVEVTFPGCAPHTFTISENANYRVAVGYEGYYKKVKNIEGFLKSCKSNQILAPSDQSIDASSCNPVAPQGPK